MSSVEHSTGDASDVTVESALAVVAVALSAGGLAPLRTVVRGLPVTIPAAVVIAQHVRDRTSLPEILSADTRLPVVLAATMMPLRPGHIYVCPAQHHLIVNPDATLSLSQRRRVHFFRPSGDWLFETAAASFRDRAFAIVLSGLQNDGARGIRSIRRAGGMVIAQNPDTCEHLDMPAAAIATGAVDVVLNPDRIPGFVCDRLRQIDFQRIRVEWNAPFTIALDTTGFAASEPAR
jgi:two-component system chemotaxis response regulator CheB